MRISKSSVATTAIGLVVATTAIGLVVVAVVLETASTREENLRREVEAARQDLTDMQRIGANVAVAAAEAGKREKRELAEQRNKAAKAAADLAFAQRELQRLRAESIATNKAAETSHAATIEALEEERRKVQSLETNVAATRQSIERLEASAKLAATKQADLLRSRQFAEASAKRADEALERERQRGTAIAEEAAADLARAQREFQRVQAAASIAAREATEASDVATKQALDEERRKSAVWESDLTTARQSIERLEASAKIAATGRTDLQKSKQFAEAAAKQADEALDRERQRVTSLANDLEIARRERVVVQEELARVSIASKEALDQEREKAVVLARHLASARQNIEVLMRRTNRHAPNASDISGINAPALRHSTAKSQRPVTITLPNALRPTGRAAEGFLRRPIER